MRVALVADAFPPMRSSAAVQMRDLAREFTRQGHIVTVIVPAWEQESSICVEQVESFEVLRIRCPRMKDVGRVRRFFAECLMPFLMICRMARSASVDRRFDGVVWYSPSIFFGPFIGYLRARSRCKTYLILRDIFPEWALDLGVLRSGVLYQLLRAIARLNYLVADTIGIQTSGNRPFLEAWSRHPDRRLEVLQNWAAEEPVSPESWSIAETSLQGRTVVAYCGNMGVAQHLDAVLRLADCLKHRRDLGFLFVGRGTEEGRLREQAGALHLDNVLFLEEMEPDRITEVLRSCAVGLVALDLRHRTQNIPGKFITYLRSGVPVFALVGASTDLAAAIAREQVGVVCSTDEATEVQAALERLLQLLQSDAALPQRCRELFERDYSAIAAVRQISAALTSDHPRHRDSAIGPTGTSHSFEGDV